MTPDPDTRRRDRCEARLWLIPRSRGRPDPQHRVRRVVPQQGAARPAACRRTARGCRNRPGPRRSPSTDPAPARGRANLEGARRRTSGTGRSAARSFIPDQCGFELLGQRHRGTPWQNQTTKLRLSRKSLIGTSSYCRSFTIFRTRHTTPNGSPATARTVSVHTGRHAPLTRSSILKRPWATD
jgi:hypothetical protein